MDVKCNYWLFPIPVYKEMIITPKSIEEIKNIIGNNSRDISMWSFKNMNNPVLQNIRENNDDSDDRDEDNWKFFR